MSFPHWTNDHPFHHHRLYSTIFHHSSLYPNFSSIFRYLQSFMTSMSMVLANKPWWFQPWFFPIDGRKKKQTTNQNSTWFVDIFHHFSTKKRWTPYISPHGSYMFIQLPPFFHIFPPQKIWRTQNPPWFYRRGLARRLRSPAPGYPWGSGSPPGRRNRSRCRPLGLSSPPRSPWLPGCWIPGWRWMDLQKNTT